MVRSITDRDAVDGYFSGVKIRVGGHHFSVGYILIAAANRSGRITKILEA